MQVDVLKSRSTRVHTGYFSLRRLRDRWAGFLSGIACDSQITIPVLQYLCIFTLRRAIPEVLFRCEERTAGTSWLVSYPGASDARRPIYRASAREFRSSCRGFWRTSPDAPPYENRDNARTKKHSKSSKIHMQMNDTWHRVARCQNTTHDSA